MKRIKLIIFFIVVLTNILHINVYAADVKDYETILYANDDNTITRYKGLIPFLKIIGINDDVASKYYNNEYAKPVFRDLYLEDNINEGYILFAGLKGIAVGDGEENFHGEEPLKIIDTILFSVRCIDNSQQYDIDLALKRAKEFGLIMDSDLKNNDLYSYISNDYYNMIIKRMLNTKANRYYQIVADKSYIDVIEKHNTDENLLYGTIFERNVSKNKNGGDRCLENYHKMKG